MFHFHKWQPSVNRIQTCSRCGVERVVGCAHTFEILKEITVMEWEMPVGKEFVLRCSQCGDITTRTSGKTTSTGMVDCTCYSR